MSNVSTPETIASGASPSQYDPGAIERKWQTRWAESGANSPDLDLAAKPFYQLMMFPYPSAEGLHIGNLYAFTGNDIQGRFQRQRGHTVFEPIGFDAFGIHSENYALKVGIHPMDLIPRNIENFRRQLRRGGLMVDWSRDLSTTDPAYYKWTQWIFLELLKRGLAYRKKAGVNWCPVCKTVLANEQVVGGECERHPGVAVEQRFLEQWFFRITDYAQRLLDNLDWIDWSDSTKTSQRNWIGRSEGARIVFETTGAAPQRIDVFTTRADTVFGATYLVLAPEHTLVDRLVTAEHRAAVNEYLARAARQDLVSRKAGDREKTGVFTGSYAVNPATGQEIPIWIADYVLMEYGTGAIMAVPGHDDRDHEFATKFGLPIARVIAGNAEEPDTPLEAAFSEVEECRLVNSGRFDGLAVEEGKREITRWLESRGAGKAVVNFRLHDWCISRQRYWGPPIPIIYCERCGAVPVSEQDLPVVLPYLEDFRPDDTGISPLARNEDWYRVPCPSCGAMGRRETDVSDTFLDSAWYFLRYPSTEFDDRPFDAERTRNWLPVDFYIGGNEHAVLHLLYTRFITMALYDAGYVEFEEPFRRFRAHGMIIREGAKMSKSRGNVLNPDEYIERWGADAFRMYLMFIGPFEEGGDFRDRGISGVRRFLDRLWASVHESSANGEPDAPVMRKLHQTIRKVGDDTARLSYNTAIAAMMEYINMVRAGERRPHRAEVEPLVRLAAPYAPHMAQELWERIGNAGYVMDGGWPEWDAALAAEETIELAIQVNGRMRGRVAVSREVTQDEALAAARAAPAIAKFITGEPRKVIFVPERLLNVVV